MTALVSLPFRAPRRRAARPSLEKVLSGSRSAAPLSTGEFVKRTIIVVAVALVPVLFWFLFDVILITLGAILIAVLVWLVAEPFMRWCRCPEPLALLISGAIIVGVLCGVAYLFGSQMQAEMQDVLNRAAAASAALVTRLDHSQFGKFFLSHVQGGGDVSIPSLAGKLFTVSTSVLEAFAVTVIAGFYLAAQPEAYRRGLSKLFPPEWRAFADETIDDIGVALRLWLLGDLIQMLLVGFASTVAVWLIGLPSPLALGLIAGVAEFVPYLGPVIAAIPALLVATTQGTSALLWTAVAYLLIHQVEGNVIAPLIQRRMVFIPPAVMLLGIVTILFVFGGVAMIFAAPMAVIIFVAVEKLYLRDGLGEKVALPGETAPARSIGRG
jgi:predicted PurR-regulated permease PerM